MGKKYPHHARNPNVSVPLDPGLFTDLLYRGIGGQFEAELRAAHAEGLTPFTRTCDPSAYGCSDSFRRDYQLATMYSKFDDGKSSESKVTAALEKFRLGEDRCSDTNHRLYTNQDVKLVNFASARDVLYVARNRIGRLLGDFSWNEAELGFGFGPGATSRLPRVRSTLLHKISGRPEATFNNTELARAVLRHNMRWEAHVLSEPAVAPNLISQVRANRVTTVPKNAETDRVIAIEPDMNMYVQKGIGRMIRRRLKRVGVDLNDQSLNQRLAHLGSISGKLATIDLSMASDTVSLSIVQELLPMDWLSALEQCRSPFGVLPSGAEILYRKFSSMGNGYTFELESLIFWALCSALVEVMGERDVTLGVYGDDLIVPVGIVPALERLLEYCGFSFNRKKSFASGPFRESCGKHYFGGRDVTPFFIKHQPRRLIDGFLVHNNVIRWSNKESFIDSGNGGLVESFCREARLSAPANWRRPRIPLGYGDGAFVGPFDACCPDRASRKFEGFRATVLVEVQVDENTKTRVYPTDGPIVASLHFLEAQSRGVENVLRFASSDAFRASSYGPEIHPLDTFYRGVGSADSIGSGKDLPSSLRFIGSVRSLRGKKVTSVAQTKVRTVIKHCKMLVPQWADLGPWY